MEKKILKTEVQILKFAAPVCSTDANSAVKEQHKQHNENVIKLMDDQGCNHAKGIWVVDDSRLLCSGFHCEQWLPRIWAFCLIQRKDFPYEKLRWQLKNCQTDEFEGPEFLERYQYGNFGS